MILKKKHDLDAGQIDLRLLVNQLGSFPLPTVEWIICQIPLTRKGSSVWIEITNIYNLPI